MPDTARGLVELPHLALELDTGTCLAVGGALAAALEVGRVGEWTGAE